MRSRTRGRRGGSSKRVTSAPRRSVTRVEVVRESKPRAKANPSEVLDAQHTGVAYSAGRANPYSTRLGGALYNPDPVLMQNGAVNEAFYDGIMLRHPIVAGLEDQKIDRANRERIIVAGDPSDARSIAIAEEARRHFRKVNDKPVTFGRFLRNVDFIGFGGVEKVFTRDTRTGFVYPYRLIDRKCENIKFRDDGTALWCPRGYAYSGEPIPKRKMIFGRSGSTNTQYGDGVGRYVYPATVLIEKAFELMLDSVEEFGRPIPVVYMPRATDALTKPEREKIRAYARSVHSRFIELPTNEMVARIDVGNAAMVSAGQIGRPEIAIIEMLVTWIYVRMIRVAQTLNKTGGSRALEDTRYDITDDASRPLCILLDSFLNAQSSDGADYTGWMADFCDFNFADEPEEILPRFETPSLAQDAIAAIHKRAMDLIDRGVSDLSKDWYMRHAGVETAKDKGDRLGGVPSKTKASETATSDSSAGVDATTLESLAARANVLARELDTLVRLAA
jgi:hypothetical protein